MRRYQLLLSLLWLPFVATTENACDKYNCTMRNAHLQIRMVGLPPFPKSTTISWWSMMSPNNKLEYNILYNVTSNSNSCECPSRDAQLMYIAPQCKRVAADAQIRFECGITENVSKLHMTEKSGLCVVARATASVNPDSNFTCFSLFNGWSQVDCAVCPAPENVHINADKRGTLIIRWDASRHLTIVTQRYSTYYRIYYIAEKKGATLKRYNYENTSKRTTNYTYEISGLLENQMYRVWVECSLTGTWGLDCQGERAGPYNVTTAEGVPSSPPKICGFDKSLDGNKSYLVLTYELPPREKWNGFPVRYEVEYCTGPAYNVCSITTVVNTSSVRTHNKDLCNKSAQEGMVIGLAHEKYSFHMRMCTKAGCSDWSSPLHHVSFVEDLITQQSKATTGLSLTEWVVLISLVIFIFLVIAFVIWFYKSRGQATVGLTLDQRIPDPQYNMLEEEYDSVSWEFNAEYDDAYTSV